MSRLGGWLKTLDDRMNPMVVKELRQAVRGRFVPLLLCLLLLILMITMSIFFASSADTNSSPGFEMMLSFLAIFMLASVIMIPLFVGIRLGMERSEENLDLLYVTTLPARRIIAGKLLAGIIVSGVLLFAALPFMTLTFLLRGIDIPTILILVFVTFLVSTLCLQFSITIACFSVKRSFKVLLGICALGCLIFAYFATLISMSELNLIGIGGQLLAGNLWPEILAWSLSFSFVLTALFLISVAMVKPRVANRAKPVRLFLTAGWLVSFPLTEWLGNDSDRIYIWTALVLMVSMVALVVAGCEREGVSRLMRQTIPSSSIKRLAAFFFYSGCANGIAWSSLILSSSLAACIIHYGSSVDEDYWIMVAIALYTFAYVNTSVFVRNKWFATKVKKGYTWLITLFILTALTTIPWILTLLFFPSSWNNMSVVGMFHILNPFVLNAPNAPLIWNLAAVSLWCLSIAAIQVRWFFAQYRFFRPASSAAQQPLESPAT